MSAGLTLWQQQEAWDTDADRARFKRARALVRSGKRGAPTVAEIALTLCAAALAFILVPAIPG